METELSIFNGLRRRQEVRKAEGTGVYGTELQKAGVSQGKSTEIGIGILWRNY